MPQEPSRFPETPPRVRGENARLSQQKQTIEEELDTAVDRPGDEPVSRGRGSLGRRSTPALVEQPGDHLGRTGRDHGQARNHLRPRSAVLRRCESVGPERLSCPVSDQPGIRGFTSSAEELRAGGTFAGHAAEALRERIRSSADPQDQRGRKQAPCQRECRRGDGFQLGSSRRVPQGRGRTTQTDPCGPRTYRRRYPLPGEHRVRAGGRLWLLSSVGGGVRTPARALPKC